MCGIAGVLNLNDRQVVNLEHSLSDFEPVTKTSRARW